MNKFKPKQKLNYCGRCKENSVVVKVRTGKDGVKTRIWICINKGHGLICSQEMPN